MIIGFVGNGCGLKASSHTEVRRGWLIQISCREMTPTFISMFPMNLTIFKAHWRMKFSGKAEDESVSLFHGIKIQKGDDSGGKRTLEKADILMLACW